MLAEGRRSLGTGSRRLCHLGWQLGAGLTPSLSWPRQGPGLWAPGGTAVPEARLLSVGCRERQRARQGFSLGESREKGPGDGCAVLEGMGQGYGNRRPHPLADRQ